MTESQACTLLLLLLLLRWSVVMSVARPLQMHARHAVVYLPHYLCLSGLLLILHTSCLIGHPIQFHMHHIAATIHVTVSLLVMVRRPVGWVLEDTPQRGCFQAIT